jgi:hypothetical protein
MTAWKITAAFVGVAVIVLLTATLRHNRHDQISCIRIAGAMQLGGDCQ